MPAPKSLLRSHFPRTIILAFLSLVLLLPNVFAAEPVVDSPTFSAPVQSFDAPVQTGLARKATVKTLGFYKIPDGVDRIFSVGRPLPILPGGVVFTRTVDDFYAGGAVLWTGAVEITGDPGSIPPPSANALVNEAGDFVAICRTERDEEFYHNFLKECAPNWYFGKGREIIGVRKNEKGEKVPNALPIRVSVPRPLAAGKAELRVALNSNAPPKKSNQITIRLNRTVLLQDFAWNGPGYRILRVECDNALLNDGVNVVELLGDDRYVKQLDWVEIAAPAHPTLQSGSLVVQANADANLALADTGYAADITDFGAERPLPQPEGDTPEFTLEKGRLYYFSDHVDTVEFGPETTLHLPALEGASYVAVGPRALLPGVDALLAKKRDDGLSTASVVFEEVLDVYNSGIYGPDALVKLLAQFKPAYLLIAGGFDRDCRARQDNHSPAKGWYPGVPAAMRHLEQLTISDDPYMLDYAVKVGRVPLNTAEDLAIWAEKAVAYEPPDALVLLAGSNEKVEFSQLQSDLVRKAPAAYVEANGHSPEEVRNTLFGLMKAGSHLVVYQGHAQSYELDKGLLDSSHSSVMPASSWLLATCNTAYYHGDFEVCARDWMSATDSGLVNALASASVGTAGQQDQLARRFLDYVRDNPETDWGGMMHYLKQNLPLMASMMNDPNLAEFLKRGIPEDRMTIDAYSFLGDPAARVWAREPRTAVLERSDSDQINQPLPSGSAPLVLRLEGPWDAAALEAKAVTLRIRNRSEEDWIEYPIETPLHQGENEITFDSSVLGQDGGLFEIRVLELHPDLPETVWVSTFLSQDSALPGVPEIMVRKPPRQQEDAPGMLFCLTMNRSIQHRGPGLDTQFQVRDSAHPDQVLVDTGWQAERRLSQQAPEEGVTLEIRARWKKNGFEGEWSEWRPLTPDAPQAQPPAAAPEAPTQDAPAP